MLRVNKKIHFICNPNKTQGMSRSKYIFRESTFLWEFLIFKAAALSEVLKSPLWLLKCDYKS